METSWMSQGMEENQFMEQHLMVNQISLIYSVVIISVWLRVCGHKSLLKK